MIAIFGSIIGSFLNVVILRYGTGQDLGGRSGCLSCGYQLKWYDMIPIFSWFYLKGSCRECHSKFSVQYPLVELSTALIFVAIFAKVISFGISPLATFGVFIWQAILFSILIVIFVYDLRHKIIPNKLVYTFSILALVQAIYLNIFQISFGSQAIWNLLAGPLFFLPFFLLWFISKGQWIGLGDGKLALGIGWFLGLIYGLSAIILAFWIGAIYAIFLMFIDRLFKASQNITMKTEIPFGPFLIIGILIQYFWQIDFIGLGFFF